MLLAIDIGNTNIVVALVDGEKIRRQWRIASDTKRTGDEYTSILRSFINEEGISASQIENAIISSVVPLLIGPFITTATALCGKKPVLVNQNIYDKLPVKIPQTAVHEIGTDLLCNAVQAYTEFKCANIVVDFGTALTFTTTDSKGNIQGVCIAPGIKTAVNSLFANTAQLPSVPLEAPPSALAQNTIHSIQSGIILGYKGLVESLINAIKTDLFNATGDKPQDVKVIATGGLNSVLKPITDVFSVVDKDLTVKGLVTISRLV